MGACSSAQKKTDPTAKASNGVSFKAKEVPIPPAVKEKAINEEKPVNMLGAMSPEFEESAAGSVAKWKCSSEILGSKEEKFFDSKVCIDTDCEDEFLSVNGDFTPSRCSTPNSESIKLMTPRKSMSSENFLCSKPAPSPTGRKKLAELLRETSRGDEQQSDANGYKNGNLKLVESSLEADVYGSGDGSIAEANSFSEKRKMNPLNCCA